MLCSFLMPQVNQELIARRLNISRTTVSRCFTNHRGINPNTRARVFSLAAKLGYQYLEPRSLSKKKKQSKTTRSIGVLICSDAEEFHRGDFESPGVEMLPSISEFAQLHHWQIEMHFVSPLAESIADDSYAAITSLKKRLFSGLLLMYPFAPRVIEELSTRFPCVSLVEQYGNTSVDCVDVDHYKGISMLIDRLCQHGHSRIGFFSRRYAVEAVWSLRRFSAYVEKLTRLGLPYIEKDVFHLDISTPQAMAIGYDHVRRQIESGVTAWICAADHQAYDLIAALKKLGVSVPKDVSVTGFDGILRPHDAPALDTVQIPYYEIGFAASRRLFHKMHKRFDAPQQILLDCRLQDGDTIGPCRTAH